MATAKRLVKGVVGIDAEAGPTEIAILADATANPGFIAADMISQAEHDPNAAAVLITDSPELAEAVREALENQCATTKHSERVRIALGGKQSAIILVDDLAAGHRGVQRLRGRTPGNPHGQRRRRRRADHRARAPCSSAPTPR